MTYDHALLIVHNPEAYSRETVSEAAAKILGTMNASTADLNQAVTATVYRF